MKILQIHKYHRRQGGAETYYLNLSRVLRNSGHEVANFSMEHEDNISSKWSKYFVSNVDFRDYNLRNLVKVNLRMIYSLQAKNKIGKLLDEFKPDIVHIHNIYYSISPSILPEIKNRKIPIIYTVHDYHLMTPNIVFFHSGEICDLGVNNSLIDIVLHKCVREHYLGSFVTGATVKIHERLGLYKNNIDCFIAPSGFMKNKLQEYNYDSEKIIHLPNFVDVNNFYSKPIGKGNKHILYFGRFYEQKGVLLIPEIAKRLTKVKFKIVGEGPVELELKKRIKEYGLKNIEIIDFQNPRKIKKLIAECYFSIVPSLWYEPFPYSILESFASGKPVVASKIGGIPDLIKNGENGYLVEPGNIDQYTDSISSLWNNDKRVKKMGKSAREYVKVNYNIESHYDRLMKEYRRLVYR